MKRFKEKVFIINEDFNIEEISFEDYLKKYTKSDVWYKSRFVDKFVKVKGLDIPENLFDNSVEIEIFVTYDKRFNKIIESFLTEEEALYNLLNDFEKREQAVPYWETEKLANNVLEDDEFRNEYNYREPNF